jgi:hypothetical protein
VTQKQKPRAVDFDSFTFAERRHHLGRDAAGGEGEPDFVLEVVIPAQSFLFRTIGVDDDFVVDSFLANAVLGTGCSIR